MTGGTVCDSGLCDETVCESLIQESRGVIWVGSTSTSIHIRHLTSVTDMAKSAHYITSLTGLSGNVYFLNFNKIYTYNILSSYLT